MLPSTNYYPGILLAVITKVFEKLVIGLLITYRNVTFFSDFQCGFRSSWSTTVVSDRIARVFNRSGTTRAVLLDISKAFDRVWQAVLLHKLKSYGMSGQHMALFLLFSVIDSFKWFWMGSLHKNIQLMLEFVKGPFLVLHFLYYTLMTLLMMLYVLLASMSMILLSVLNVIMHLICGNS